MNKEFKRAKSLDRFNALGKTASDVPFLIKFISEKLKHGSSNARANKL